MKILFNNYNEQQIEISLEKFDFYFQKLEILVDLLFENLIRIVFHENHFTKILTNNFNIESLRTFENSHSANKFDQKIKTKKCKV